MSAHPDIGRPEPSRRTRHLTRLALIHSATRVIARNGLHHANIATISREARLTRGAFYSNYAGVADLFKDVLGDLQARRLQCIEHLGDVPDLITSSDRTPYRIFVGHLRLWDADPFDVLALDGLRVYALRHSDFAKELLARDADYCAALATRMNQIAASCYGQFQFDGQIARSLMLGYETATTRQHLLGSPETQRAQWLWHLTRALAASLDG